MVPVWVMVVVAAVVLTLPFALMVGLNGRDRTDSRGRRLDRTWRPRRIGESRD